MLKVLKKISLILGAHLVLSPIFVFVDGRLIGGEAIAVELSEIRDRGYITIGVKDNRAPLSFLDDSGSYAGYEIEIARRLAEGTAGR